MVDVGAVLVVEVTVEAAEESVIVIVAASGARFWIAPAFFAARPRLNSVEAERPGRTSRSFSPTALRTLRTMSARSWNFSSRGGVLWMVLVATTVGTFSVEVHGASSCRSRHQRCLCLRGTDDWRERSLDSDSRCHCLGFLAIEKISKGTQQVISDIQRQLKVMSWSAGTREVPSHSNESPVGPMRMLLLVSSWQPVNSWVALNCSFERVFWKKVPPSVKSTPND
ncbi:hypothetical protein KC361_g160 [Hortaea werneckii]|nr:hypothetical protein KC361_g160 [Hortaea werneckii]